MKQENSSRLFAEAQNYIPGGVNSPVRAFKSVGGNPVFIKSAKGAYVYDEDDNRYIELINSWGPMILGHAHPEIAIAVEQAIQSSLSFGAPTAKEVEIAKLICEIVPSVEKVRMVNSGTEATMSAVRVARGYTKREKFIKFQGCYHGHGDSFLIAAGSGAVTMGNPDSPGVTVGTAKDTLLAPFHDIEALERLIYANPDQIAALILEPVAGNMGCIAPTKSYLQEVRNLCTKHGIILIFDEVMTGFRLALGGVQALYGITPDMTTMGKIIGGGMPVGAYGGKAEIMNCVSPVGAVYQAGTLSGNPIAMSAGLTMLNMLKQDAGVYDRLERKTKKITNGIRRNLEKLDLHYTINEIGSMFTLFFTDIPVHNFEEAKTSDLKLFGKYFQAMLRRGIYLAPSQFESLFVSDALSDQDIEKIIDANYESLREIHYK